MTTVDANTFVGRLQTRTGQSFDLPTEAQWEYACRSGTTGSYNNGNDLALLGRYQDTRNDKRGGYIEHTTVGYYLSNGWGHYDMHGNVYDWCLDWYGTLDALVVAEDAVGAVSGSSRVLRGGSWEYNHAGLFSCSSSNRSYTNYYGGCYNDGFRLCLTLSTNE